MKVVGVVPVIVNVPLYPATPTPATSTVCPVVKPCAAPVVIVTVVPDSVAVVMLAVANVLLIVGGPITVSEAFAVLPVPALLELTAPVMLFFTPAVVPVTSTLIVQLLLDARLPPLKLRVVSPANGVNVPPQPLLMFGVLATCNPVPPQPLLMFGVLATCNPAGRLSVNARPFSVTLLFGFVIVKLNVLLAFNTMLVGLNDLVI